MGSLRRYVRADVDGAPRVTVEEVKRRMDEGENLVLLDVRRGSWYRSDVKIKGARRVELERLSEQYDELAPGADVVTYCT